MQASSFLPDPDGSPLAEADRRALSRFLEQSLDHGFSLAIIEAADHADREAILAEVASVIGPRLLRVAIDELPGADANLWMALQEPFTTQAPRCVALWGFDSHSRSDWIRQLNIQRDLFVRDIAVPWLLFIHPATRVPLLQAAPDFCDFAILWLRDDRTQYEAVDSAVMHTQGSLLASGEQIGGHPLLQQARAALDAARFDAARDALSQFDLQRAHDVLERVYRQLLGARLEREQGRPALAEALVRDARNTLERQPSNVESQTLTRLADAELSIVLQDLGRYSEAEALLRKSLPLVEQALGREHPDYGAFLNNLGDALRQQGKYAEAEHLLRDSLSIHAIGLGRDHPAYATTLNGLAGALIGQGKYAEAERHFRESIHVKAMALGPEHPSVGTSLHNLAVALAAQGKYPEAEAVIHDALALKEKVLGREHPDHGRLLQSLAFILSTQGKHAEAEHVLRASLPLFERALGPVHPDYSRGLTNLATTLLRQGKSVEAERALRDALSLTEKTLGREHPGYSESLQALAQALSNQGKYAEAETLLREALSLLEKALQPGAPRLCSTLAALAAVAARQRRTREGIRLLERAIHIGQAALAPDHPSMQQMRDQLKQFQRRRLRP